MYLQILCARLWLFHISDLDISIKSPSSWWLFCLDDLAEEKFAAPFTGSWVQVQAYVGSLLWFCSVQNKATRSY